MSSHMSGPGMLEVIKFGVTLQRLYYILLYSVDKIFFMFQTAKRTDLGTRSTNHRGTTFRARSLELLYLGHNQ